MKACRYDLAIFDLDGTLLDTAEGISHALCDTLRELGYGDTKKAELSAFIGPPIELAFRRLLGLEGKTLTDAAARFRYLYRTKHLKKATPYTDIFALLEVLGSLGVKLAVATYKREIYAKELLAHYGFLHRIPVIFGSDSEGLLKKSDLIRLCMKASDVSDPARAIMIGDTAEDARGATEAGVDFIAVTYGFGFHSKADAAPYQTVGVADTPNEILSYF